MRYTFEEFCKKLRDRELYEHAKRLTDATFAHIDDEGFAVLNEIHREMMDKLNDEQFMMERYTDFLLTG